MREVYVIGAHTIKFGKHLDHKIPELVGWTVEGVLRDAGVERQDIQSAWFSNSGWGLRDFQHCIRGQVALRPLGIDGIPITNVENACAGGSTAFHGAWKDVALGLHDVSLAVGVEKIYDRNKYSIFAGFISGLDVDALSETVDRLQEFAPDPAEIPPAQSEAARKTGKERKPGGVRGRLRNFWNQFSTFVLLGEALGYDTVRKVVRVGMKGDRSPFMDVYAYAARRHMKTYGTSQRQIAAIAAKNHRHSTMNPNAQYTFDMSIDDVMHDRLISYPLTRSMCAPIGDGAASAVLVSGEMAERLGVFSRAVRIRASVLASGREREWDDTDIAVRASRIAYEQAGLGPEDIEVCEVHDATAFGELAQTEHLGFFPKGEGGPGAERGETTLGGRIPVNPSGGLLSRGHPVGASGLAQIHELVTQIRGEAGKRQVEGARIALAENGGGVVGNEEAAMCIHILEKAT